MLNISNNRIDKFIPTDRLYTLRSLRPPDAGRVLAQLLLVICIIFFIVLFLPWQQNIHGTGSVTAFNPKNRPQSIQAIIGGRIQKWHINEGQHVNAGDTIVTIAEVKEKYFDPNLLGRMQEQILAKTNGLSSKDQKIQALTRQVKAMRSTMEFKLNQLKAKLDAEAAKFEISENQYQRNKKLFEAGNIALTKFQEVEYKYQIMQADFLNAQTELDRIRAEYLDKISKTESEISNTYAELFESQADLSKLRNEYVNVEMRSAQYQILAPQRGIIVKTVQSGLGETIKEGESVCTIMPEAVDVAVEMYVKAMDIPLLSKGRKVRIEFDGWPALQFSGWPSVSVGTFGGTVKVIDYVNSKPGEFRILVVPDSEDEPWPQQIRVGSGTKGWIMLNDVPVWYEVWRQLNGFPPSLYEAPLEEVVEKNSKDISKSK